MAEHDPKFVAGSIDSVTHLADGNTVFHGDLLHNGMEPEEAREGAARMYNVDPEQIVISHVEGEPYDGTSRSPRRHLGRKSVAFTASRWRASWDPHADPTQN